MTWPLPFFPGFIYWPCRAGILNFFVLFVNGLIGSLVLSKRHFKILFYFRPPFLGYTWSCYSVVLLFRGLIIPWSYYSVVLSPVITSCAPFLSKFHWCFVYVVSRLTQVHCTSRLAPGTTSATYEHSSMQVHYGYFPYTVLYTKIFPRK